jgi:two-component system, sensor histidine kinase
LLGRAQALLPRGRLRRTMTLKPTELPASEQAAGILVVDDSASNLLAVRTALEGLDEDVVQAQSGNEALRHLLARNFALILLDVQMPSMDGFQTARLIRKRERNRHTPIIFITAHDYGSQDMLNAYAMGAVDFLFKPIVPEILRAKASVLIALQKRTAEVAEQAALLREQERRLHEQELARHERRWEEEALRRQMEVKSRVAEEMARRAEELRRTVAERQAAQAELTLINQRLEESDRRKDEFLAVLAHELRNPLAPIVTSLDLFEILGKQQGPEAAEKLAAARAAMQRQVQHLVRLVDDLLDISRISSGKIELCKEAIELTPVIEQAIVTAQHLLHDRNQSLILDLAEESIALSGDTVRLTQVVANLLNNAARYTPPGGTITVSTMVDNGEAVICIRDSGQGIPDEMIDSIFDTFVQFRPRGGGLGLGLTLVRRLVELHGGNVTAKSFGSDKGSEFVVRLPARNEAAFSVASEEAPAASSGAPLDVVVIEDHEDIREMVTLLLTNQGHSVKAASSGSMGADLCLTTRPDAALVDIGLDDLDGYAVARRVCAELGPEAPYLIAMTGFGQEKDRRRAFEAGFKAHLIKPATADEIANVLARVPSRRSPNALKTNTRDIAS